MQRYIYSESKTQMLKKFSSGIINVTKNALLFPVRAPTHQSFTFDLRFLNELKNNVHLSKIVYGIFHFQFRLIFIKIYILLNKKNELFDFKTS